LSKTAANTMKKFRAIVMLLLSIKAICIYAEEDPKNVNIEVDFVSRYMWRGYSLGGPGFQASIDVGLFENNLHALTVEAWGYTDFDVSTKEIDFSLSYVFLKKKAAFILYDYWYVPEITRDYFDYRNHSTSHILEAQLNYFCNLTETDCLTFNWATIVYGNDKKLSPTGSYKQAYSAYFEVNYKGGFLSSTYGCEASIGFSPWESPTNYMVENFSWINAELKFDREFVLGNDVELRPSVTLTMNPKHNDAYLSFGLAFSF